MYELSKTYVLSIRVTKTFRREIILASKKDKVSIAEFARAALREKIAKQQNEPMIRIPINDVCS